ncbi:lactonase family protein [Streptomyces purpureus]|uniref:lactonase family protein n=1 Tax=Streptomyces purpureus TaxID=1951 RepID=UPI0037AC8537
MGGTDGKTAGLRAYIGSFTSAGGRGITAATVDEATGALTPTGWTDAVADPSYLALDPSRPVLHAVSETEEGAVAAFSVDGPRPRPLGEPVAVRGSGPTHLCVTAGHVLTANYGSGSVTALPLAPDGTPGPARDVLRHEGGGPDPDRQSGPHAHQVLPDPSGRWVLAVDLGTDSVTVAALDPSGGTLRLHSQARLRPGSGPRHLAFHPSGTYAYILNELTPTLTVCRWHAEKGALTPLHEVPVLPEDTPAGTVRWYPSGIVVAPDGRFLWAAVRGHDGIAVLALDPAGERPAPVAAVGCGGRWPRDLALDPSGRRLYVANERSGDVTWFDLDPETGLPRRKGALEAPAASCVVLG